MNIIWTLLAASAFITTFAVGKQYPLRVSDDKQTVTITLNGTKQFVRTLQLTNSATGLTNTSTIDLKPSTIRTNLANTSEAETNHTRKINKPFTIRVIPINRTALFNRTSGSETNDGTEQPQLTNTTTASNDTDVDVNVIMILNETSVVDSNSTDQAANASRCYSFNIPCRDGNQCVHFSQFCDLNPDCADGSDEDAAFCKEGVPVVTCADGEILQGHSARCDGFPDCLDGSDETGCHGSPFDDLFKQLLNQCPWQYQFQCGEGTCIDKSLVCDGSYDCPFGADESVSQCAVKTANEDSSIGDNWRQYGQVHVCSNKEIVISTSDVKCNGVKDCKDGSDEAQCDTLYYCANGQSFPTKGKIECDGFYDCLDESDEANCHTEESETMSISRLDSHNSFVVVVVSLSVALLVCLLLIIVQYKVNRNLKFMLLKQAKKRPIVLAEPTRPPSYSEVVGNREHC